MSDTALRPPAPLLSAQWFRMAGLRPRLDAQARIERMVVRGAVWQVISRADGTRSFRLDRTAWTTVACSDGRRTVQQLWHDALAGLGDDAPTQDELLDILARLHAAGLMSFDRAPDFGVAPEAAPEPAADPQRRNTLLAWRVPLGCPDALLARWAPQMRVLFTPAALVAWLVLVGAALLALLPHTAELSAWLGRALATPHVLAFAAVAYPLVKLLHELAHGLAARHFGARVPEWGVALLMAMPVPYVDASAASALPQARQRGVVAAAGIVTELALAAVAVLAALAVEPGLVRDAALAVFFLCALSTLLVNANPLLRFDGYHMLVDAAGLPNLAARSTRWWWHGLRRRVLRLDGEAPMPCAPGEAAWLRVYAPLALVMRWVVAASLVAWLGGLSALLGAAALALMLGGLVVAPLRAAWRWQRRAACAEAERARAVRRTVVLVVLPLIALLGAPWPDRTVAQGVLWLPEHALLRAQADGLIDAVLVADGQPVHAGDALVQMRAPEMQARAQGLRGRIEALESERLDAQRDDPARAAAATHALVAAQSELGDVEDRLSQLIVRAQADGRVAIPRAADLPGRYLARGSLIGHVITGEPGLVRVAIPHEEAARVADHAGIVQVRTAGGGGDVLQGRWAGTPSGGGAQLPSAALSERHGGRIATRPDDRDARQPERPVVVGVVQLDGAALPRLGERVLVRFEHGWRPLALQALRAMQQQVLRHFHPAQ